MLVFPRFSFFCSSPTDSVKMTRSSAYRFSQGHTVWNSWDMASRTVMNSKGLIQEPWWTPTFMLNSSLWLQPTCTLLLSFSYMLCRSLTRHFSMLSLPTSIGYTIECLFQIDKGHVHKTFLVTGVQWIWHLWCCVQAWSQTACLSLHDLV